uniref:hypothetical protein n=1 Tax=Vibrio cholerae TaxID=666 RepID=UPI003F58858C
MRESNKIPTILVGRREEKTVFIVMAQAFRKRGSFSSRHKMLNQMTQDSLTLAALGFQHRSTA